MTHQPSAHSWLAEALADSANGWSVGTFGAIAEFMRDPGEPVDLGLTPPRISATTARGAIRLVPDEDLVPVAYETPSADGETWNQAIALCLPETRCAMNRRSALTEIGPDEDAIRDEDRGAILFDMGLGALPVDVCIRTHDPDLICTLRAAAGRSLFETGNAAMAAIVGAGPHRVFVSRPGRAEVYQPIPPPDGRSPDGPHTHLLPKLLQSGRTHAATTPIPDGLVPCAHLYPPNPLKDALGQRQSFDAVAHAAFQALYETFGPARLLAIKRETLQAISAGVDPVAFAAPSDKHGRAALRVALRQMRVVEGGSGTLDRWRNVHDRGRESGAPDEDEQPAH